ncbi:hypothetical protein GP486_004930 [Trichoglossum hirsutum]|uniref:NAD(P)-binding protein n=1 Tax=Trichoglossum hirsutum TaxID=265104 RepID=A0A9P8RNP8_9PEZI|nr:hypothetical protein GP486_004930 [Trichoglossum hirsutum]
MADQYLESLEDLTGKVAVVTGGAASIGLETTILLARKGCTVYVASRNRTKATLAIDTAVARLSPDAKDRVIFHHLDLSSIPSALESANAFLSRKDARLDILIGNAAIMTPTYTLNPDGIESTFATNVLGHFAFITTLLPLLKKAENARVVVVNSLAYANVPAIDYGELTREKGEDGTSVMDLRRGFMRYGVSKLGLTYFTRELDKRLRDEGVKTIKVNTCHPGTASSSYSRMTRSVPTNHPSINLGIVSSTSLGNGSLSPLGRFVEYFIRTLVGLLDNTAADAAKTQVFLAAGKLVRDDDVHGEYWLPIFSWSMQYCGCRPEEVTKLAMDEVEQEKLWAFCEDLVGRARCGPAGCKA